MPTPWWDKIDRPALLIVTAVSFVGLMVSVATALVFLEAPANFSGFNQSYIYGFPLGWIVIEKIATPAGQVREITHIDIAQFVADYAIWTAIVGIVALVFDRGIFRVNRTSRGKLTSRSKK